ncbi:MAG: conserved phage C-terminal domain-containing protein [Candidatus Woesearchaeota archaeon]
MPGNGWIKLYRKVQDNVLWQDKPFSKGQAWIDLLLEVNHKENKILFNSDIITVGEGEKITSIRKLCDMWGWSNTKVVNFLELLKEENMITYKSDTKKTVIKVLNYRDYQKSDIEENDTKATAKLQQKDTKATQKHTNNNEKNIKNVKNEKNNNGSSKTTENIPFKEIINYLNHRTGSNYRHTTKKTKDLIQARWNEGFKVEDFKTVIDKKCVEWMNNDTMARYLRPNTLFGTKFEDYLNQINVQPINSGKNTSLIKSIQEDLEWAKK